MADTLAPRKLDGFAGVWYGNQPTDPPYHWKYSGGLGTYPQQHAPIAIHREDVRRTYFVFGSPGKRPAQPGYKPRGKESDGETGCCISYFDHDTHTLARPVELMVRDVIDAHENPVVCIDDAGRLLVFCPAHGSGRPSHILRSAQPHDIHSFEVACHFEAGHNFSYPQPWWIADHGMVFLHTFYEPGGRRRLGVTRSGDGVTFPGWDEKPFLSKIAEGSYQISWPRGDGLLATAFDMHPKVEGGIPLNHRTNIYYAQSADGGKSWQTATGDDLALPLTDIANPARVYDGQADGLLVYLKDLQFDPQGRPVIVYLTSTSCWPGPDGGPHTWKLAKFNGQGWSHHTITTSDHNYDHGSLLFVADDDWRLIAPASPGPQACATGGQMTLWQSRDQGVTWVKVKPLIVDPAHNHTYARRPLDAHAGFAMLWAAADAHHPSCSSFYFCDADGKTWKMPEAVAEDFMEPEPMD